jgi:hypothetical protein
MTRYLFAPLLVCTLAAGAVLSAGSARINTASDPTAPWTRRPAQDPMRQEH